MIDVEIRELVDRSMTEIVKHPLDPVWIRDELAILANRAATAAYNDAARMVGADDD